MEYFKSNSIKHLRTFVFVNLCKYSSSSKLIKNTSTNAESNIVSERELTIGYLQLNEFLRVLLPSLVWIFQEKGKYLTFQIIFFKEFSQANNFVKVNCIPLEIIIYWKWEIFWIFKQLEITEDKKIFGS